MSLIKYDRIQIVRFNNSAPDIDDCVASGFTLQYCYKRKVIKSKQLYYDDDEWRVAKGGADFSMTNNAWDYYNEPYKIR